MRNKTDHNETKNFDWKKLYHFVRFNLSFSDEEPDDFTEDENFQIHLTLTILCFLLLSYYLIERAFDKSVNDRMEDKNIIRGTKYI